MTIWEAHYHASPSGSSRARFFSSFDQARRRSSNASSQRMGFGRRACATAFRRGVGISEESRDEKMKLLLRLIQRYCRADRDPSQTIA